MILGPGRDPPQNSTAQLLQKGNHQLWKQHFCICMFFHVFQNSCALGFVVIALHRFLHSPRGLKALETLDLLKGGPFRLVTTLQPWGSDGDITGYPT